MDLADFHLRDYDSQNNVEDAPVIASQRVMTIMD